MMRPSTGAETTETRAVIAKTRVATCGSSPRCWKTATWWKKSPVMSRERRESPSATIQNVEVRSACFNVRPVISGWSVPGRAAASDPRSCAPGGLGSDAASVRSASVRDICGRDPGSGPRSGAGAGLPSGRRPTSSGRLRTNQSAGRSSAQELIPSQNQASRQPTVSMSHWANGGCSATLAENPSQMRPSAKPRCRSNHCAMMLLVPRKRHPCPR